MSEPEMRLGWIGIGRMGLVLATRLIEAGHPLAVYNRTRDKAQGLEELGATVVDSPAELADRDIVFTMVAGSADVEEVVSGPRGLLSRPGVSPRVIIDSTTISEAAAERIRAAAEERGTAVLAAPVSGNPKVAASGRLTIVASGPHEAWQQARPYLELLGRRVMYVGEGERDRGDQFMCPQKPEVDRRRLRSPVGNFVANTRRQVRNGGPATLKVALDHATHLAQ